MNPPAFQLYAADFYMDTVSWSATEVGAYFRLLMHEWVNGPLPNKISTLARIAGVDPRNMQKMWSAELAKKFVPYSANMYVNLRLEKTRAEQEEYRKTLAESGRVGGLKAQKLRRERSSDPSSKASSEIKPLQSSSSSLHNVDNNNNHRKTTIAPTYNFETHLWENLNGHLETWSKAFPALNIQIQLDKMGSWLEANPKNRKSNYTRFIHNWLSREQDRAPRVAAQDQGENPSFSKWQEKKHGE